MPEIGSVRAVGTWGGGTGDDCGDSRDARRAASRGRRETVAAEIARAAGWVCAAESGGKVPGERDAELDPRSLREDTGRGAGGHGDRWVCGAAVEEGEDESGRQEGGSLEKAGESYATNQAMIALSAFWDPLPVAGSSTIAKPGRRRKRTEISMASEEANTMPSISVATYKRICEKVGGLHANSQDASGKLRRTTDATQKIWTSVWEREFKKLAKTKSVTVIDIIRHCTEADTFTNIVIPPGIKERAVQLPGYSVVLEVVRSLFVDVPGMIAAFARFWWSAVATDCSMVLSEITVFRTRRSSAKHILRSYLAELLKLPSVRHGDMPSSMDTHLELVFFLYEMFSIVGGHKEDSYTRHWDALMPQGNYCMSVNESTRDGMNWCSFLEKCAISISGRTLTAIRYSNRFYLAFQKYCVVVMAGILVSGGEFITSGHTIQRRLINVESDRSVVRRVLTQMMTTFGEEWVSSLVARFLRAISWMKSNNQVNPKLRKTGQQQFDGVVHGTNATLRNSDPTPLYLVSLMRFCEAWDVYQSTHTKEPPSRANKWGVRAMIKLDMLPELLECYDKDSVISQESSEALVFAAEVLQNVTNCPSTLEKDLYRVIFSVKVRVDHARNSEQGPPADAGTPLISHSSDTLQRLLCAVKFADLDQTRQLVNQIKGNDGSLSELKQQLERWFSFVEVHGAAFAGKESRMELSLLATRLTRWFPNEFESLRVLFMTPLDSHLVFALKAFVKEAGKLSGPLEYKSFAEAASSLPSAVRVEMALHLYLSAAPFPDLETLTILLIKAIIKCRSPDAFGHLIKVIQKNARILLPEAAVGTLSSPLRGLEFSVSNPDQQDEAYSDMQINDYTRRAKSTIYQENALKLLAISASVFKEGVSWSAVLFDELSTVSWLPYFFEYILRTEFCDGGLRVGQLLTTLEELTQSRSDKTFKEAFWLAALLNTALVSSSRRTAGAYAELEGIIVHRLQKITRRILQLVLIVPSKATAEAGGNKNHTSQTTGILGYLSMSKSVRVVINDSEACWFDERLITEKAARVLEMSLSGAWVTGAEEAQAIVAEPAVQLLLPFSQWLAGALVYSQSFLEEPSATMNRWERTFTSYVTDLYLVLEFYDDVYNLLKEWLATWIRCNIIRGQDEMQLLALLPSQVALFRRLGLNRNCGSSLNKQDQHTTSFWKLIFAAINLTIDQYAPENTTEMEQATELVVSTLTTLELVELSASLDFARFSRVQEMDPFFTELDSFLSRSQLRACTTGQVCCLLQYPLELLVSSYACKMTTEAKTESPLFLLRVKKALQESFCLDCDTIDLTVDEPLPANDNGASPNAKYALDLTEMDGFFRYWADEMLLKYDYLDRQRCIAVLEVIQAALQGNVGTQ
ncbi:unnamed protein product [Phytophthora lilii]|uniref:Unnamed protein product n=1 Tax=Phytophthora lilii TaxID=2077276 RepID=A0A9W6UA21_9STRA|nr:unnamed protein product [Phytophthora lilii]